MYKFIIDITHSVRYNIINILK
ncbi:MAG: CRISPR-associated DxTHG motif protein [Clostridia bacterium]|nr:CRISPR-associated DxTHG motif protein [Clostridia bacterium]